MSKRAPRAILLYFSSAGLRPSAQFLSARCFSASSSLSPPSPHFFRSSPSSSSPAPDQPLWKHRNEEGSKSVRVTVWWDYENCPVPTGVNPYKVVQRITSALRAEGIRGPVSITAFADVHLLNRTYQEALFATGVSFNHVPRRGKNSSDKCILADLVYWVAQNPPPAHFFLISGDGDFTSMLHRLRLNNYNILIATRDGNTTSALSSCATILWHWNELLHGGCLAGKRFNQPPDGLHSSWYGQFKGPLEDPFALDNDPAVSQTEDHAKPPANLKGPSVPKCAVDGIVKSLSCYPNGMSTKDLLIRLKRRDIIIDDNYFGHKSFVDLIASLPHLIKITTSRSGKAVMCKLNSEESTAKTAESDSAKQEDEGQNEIFEKDEMPSLLTSDPAKEGHYLANDKKASQALSQPSSSEESSFVESKTLPCADIDGLDTATKDLNSVKDVSHVEPLQEEDPGTRKGFFRRLWTSLTGRGSKQATENSSPDPTSIRNKTDESSDCAHKTGSELKTEHGFFNNVLTWNNPKKINAEKTQEKEKGSRLSSELKSNLAQEKEKGSRLTSELKSNQVNEGYREQQQDVKCLDLKASYHDLFSRAQFWDSLELFLCTEKAKDIFTTSMTRIHLAQGLQKEGPVVLNSLTVNNISYLINLLISKQWVEECSSTTPPFKLVYPGKRTRKPLVDLSSNELSNTLPNKESHSGSQTTHSDCADEQFPKIIGTCSNKTVEKRIPKNLSELKVWFQQVSNDNSSTQLDNSFTQLEDLKSLYEKEFGRKLDSFFYGYFSEEKLLDACSGSQEMKDKSGQLSRQQILTDCTKLLTESLEKNPAGILLPSFRAMFQERYGYSLNYKWLGYPTLSSMLKVMPGVRIESHLILPATAPQPLGSDDDFSWEELGPVQGGIDKENERDKERKLANESKFDALNVSDEESSSDDDIPTGELGESVGRGISKKGEEESSLVKILESWQKSKENKENTVSQSAAGLVDCSEGTGEDAQPLDSRRAVPLSSNFKGRRFKAYRFVSDSSDNKDNVAQGILQCLK